MSKKATAVDANLGYFYQARYALFLFIQPNAYSNEISIETFDDISMEENGNPVQLIQTKQHATPKDLSNKSEDLWKTLGNWIDGMNEGNIDLSNIMLTLVTTSSAPDGSAASFLRPKGSDSRDVVRALKILQDEGSESKNKIVIPNYNKFSALGGLKQMTLLNKVNVIDNVPDIEGIRKDIIEYLAITTPRHHLDDIYDDIEGWWMGQVILCLKKKIKTIKRTDLQSRSTSMRDRYRQESLPIYNISEETKSKTSQELKEEDMLEKQIKVIKMNNSIADAKRNYVKAITHRKRWVRKNAADADDITKFDIFLKKEWEERFNYNKNFVKPTSSADELVELGRVVFKWAHFDSQDLKIRNESDLHFYTKGIFHMLSGRLEIGWHPEYEEAIEKLEQHGEETE